MKQFLFWKEFSFERGAHILDSGNLDDLYKILCAKFF